MTSFDPGSGVALITDGSASSQDRSGGWAWIALDAFDGIHKASSYRSDVTNNQMELAAPAKGLKWLRAHYGACDVLVYSDSLYVVLGATDRTRKRNNNHKFWNDLDHWMMWHTSVEFIHVKGHNGHPWNEMADRMAGAARKQGAL